MSHANPNAASPASITTSAPLSGFCGGFGCINATNCLLLTLYDYIMRFLPAHCWSGYFSRTRTMQGIALKSGSDIVSGMQSGEDQAIAAR
jgi:hypothetical protein